MGALDFLKLVVDAFSQTRLVHIAQQKLRPNNLTQFFQGLVDRMLSRIRIEPAEDNVPIILAWFLSSGLNRKGSDGYL